MTPTLRKAAILSLVLVTLTILLAVLLLDGPDQDYDTGPGEPGQGEEPADKPAREEAAEPTSTGDETGNELTDGPEGAKEPAPKPEETKAGNEAPSRLILLLLQADGEEPVGNEEFRLRLEEPAKTRDLLLRTDSDGFARVTDVPEGEYPALLRHPRYLNDRRTLTVPPEDPTAEPEVVTVLLEKGESLTGKVTDLRGEAIKGVSVALGTGTADGPQIRKATSGADGTFTVETLTVGTWRLTAFHSAYRLGGPLPIRIPTEEDLTIQLVESTNVNVFIENPDGTPCEGAHVSIRIYDAPPGKQALSRPLPTPPVNTDANGLAILTNLPAGPGVQVTLTVRDPPHRPISKNVTVDELEGGDFVMRFATSRSLGGIVLDPDGNTVANIRVSLKGPYNQGVTSTASGTFQFRSLTLPPGKYWLQAASASVGVSKRLEVDLEEESPLEVELILEPGTGAISGWIEDATGQPLGLIPLKLYSGAEISIESVSAPSGDFSFAYLPKATYTLRAGNAKFGQAQRDGLLPGTDDISLVIAKPGSLRGIIESEGPELGFSLRLQEHPGAEARGIPARTWRFTAQVARFHLENIPPGIYDLLVLRQGKETGKLEGIIIRSGEETGPVSIFSRE